MKHEDNNPAKPVNRTKETMTVTSLTGASMFPLEVNTWAWTREMAR